MLKRNDIVLVATLAVLGLTASADMAWASASTFQPLNTAMSAVLQFMTGTFATTAATVAVAAVGFLALTSRIPWSWAFSVVIGVALIFGAAQIVSSLTSGMSSGG